MPVDACIYYYECKGRHALLRPYEAIAASSAHSGV